MEAPHGRCGRECRCRRSRSSAPARPSSRATSSATSCACPSCADDTTFALMDIDAERLRASEVVARGWSRALGARRAVEATIDRRAALDGADYVVTSFQVGGYRPRRSSTSRCRSASGCARRSPTRSASAGSCAACARSPCCSTSAATWRSSAPTRCCSSTSTRWRCCAGRSPRRARSAPSGCATPCSTRPASWRADLGVPADELDYHVAGINHMAFFLRLERDGEDLYPALARDRRGGPRAGRQPRALRGAPPLRLLRHRVLRALRRVRAVVHQARPRRT